MSTRFMISAAIILIILLILYRTSAQAAVEGFASLPQPDLCSDLNATDCKRAQGCAFCSATGLCLNANKAVLCTNAYLIKDIVNGMGPISEEPMPSNSFSINEQTA